MARPRTIKFYIKLYKKTGNIEEIPEEFRDEVKNIVGDKIKEPRVKKVKNRKKALKPTDKRFGVRQSTIDKYIEIAKTGDLFGVKPKYRTPKIVAIAKKSAKKSGDYSKIPPELLTVDEAIRRYKKDGKMNGLTEAVKKGLYEYIAKTTGSLVGIKKSERTEELSEIAKNAKETMNVSKKKKAKTKKYYGPRKKTEEKYMELAKSGNLIDIPAYQRDDKKTNIALDVAREKKDFSKIPPRVLGISDAILRYELTGKASGLADNIKNDMYVYVIKKSAALAPIPVKDRSEKLKVLLKEVKKENAYKKRKELIAKKRKTKHYGPTEETKEKIMALAKAGNLKGIAHVHRSNKIIEIAKAAAKAKRDYSLIPSWLLNVEEAIDRFKLTGKADNLAPDVRQRVYKYIITATHSLDGIPIVERKKDVLKLYRELTRGENKNENESSKEKTKKYLKLAATGNLRAIPAAERTEEMISTANAWGEEHEEFKNIPTHLLSIKLAIIRYEKTKKATHLSNKIEDQVYRYIVEKTLSLDGIPQQGRSKELREYRKKLIKDKQKAEKMARQNILTKTGKKVKFPTQYVALSGKLNSFRDEDITPEMIGAANNWAISHKNFSGLPTKYMSLEAAIEYLTLTRKLNKVPEQFKDEIYKKHLENGGRLADIPYIDRSEELTIIYILQNGNLHGVPDEYKNRFSIYDALFEATGSTRNIPAQFRTVAMAKKVRTYKKYHYRGGTVRVEEHQTIEAARKKYAETGSLVGITYPHQKRIAFGVIKDLLGQKKGIVGFAHECGLNPVQFKLLINDLGIKNGIKAQYHERIRKDLQTLEEENNATYLPLAEQLNTITESLNFSTKALTVEQKIRFSHLTSVLFRKRDYRDIEMDDVYKYLYLVGKQDEYDSFKEFCELKLGFKDESQTITVKKQKDEKSDIKYREWYTEFSSKEYFKNEKHTFIDKDGKKVEITRKMVDEILKTLANANITPFSCIVKEAIRLSVLGQLTAFIETMKEDEFAFKKGALRKYTVTTYERKIEQKPFRHGIDISTLTKEGLIVDIEQGTPRSLTYLRMVSKTGNLKKVPVNERIDVVINAGLEYAKNTGNYDGIPGPCLTVEAAIDRYERTGVATKLASDVQGPVYRYIIEKTGSLDGIPANKVTEELKEYCLQVNPDANITFRASSEEKEAEYEKLASEGNLKDIRAKDRSPELTKKALDVASVTHNYSNIPGPCLTVETAIDRYELTGNLTYLNPSIKEEVYTYVIRKTCSLKPIPPKDRNKELRQLWLDTRKERKTEKDTNNEISAEKAKELAATGNLKRIPAEDRSDEIIAIAHAYANEHDDYSGIPSTLLTSDEAYRVWEQTGKISKWLQREVRVELYKKIIIATKNPSLIPTSFRMPELSEQLKELGYENQIKTTKSPAECRELAMQGKYYEIPLHSRTREFLNIALAKAEETGNYDNIPNKYRPKQFKKVSASKTTKIEKYRELALQGNYIDIPSRARSEELLNIALAKAEETGDYSKIPSKNKSAEVREKEKSKKYRELALQGNYNGIPRSARSEELLNIALAKAEETENYDNIPNKYRPTQFKKVSASKTTKIEKYRELALQGNYNGIPSRARSEELLNIALARAEETGNYDNIPNKYRPKQIKKVSAGEITNIGKYQQFIEQADYNSIPNRAKSDKTLLTLVLARAKIIGDYSKIPGPCLTVEAAIDRYEQTGIATNLANDVQDPVYRYIIEKTGSLDGIPANKRTEELKQYCLQINPNANAAFGASSEEKQVEYERLASEGNLRDIKAKDRSPELTKKALDVAKATRNYTNIPGPCLTVEAAIDRYELTGDLTYLDSSIKEEVYTYVIRKTCSLKSIPARDRNENLRQLWLDSKKERRAETIKNRKPKATNSAKKKRTAKAVKTKKGSVSPQDIEIIEVTEKSDDKINPDDIKIIEVSDDKINPSDIEIIDSGSEKAEENTGINTDIVFANDVPENIKKLLFNLLSPLERKFICSIYGLETGAKSTIKQAGESLGMSKGDAYNTRRIIVAKHPKLEREILDFVNQRKKDLNSETSIGESLTLIDNAPDEIRKLISRIPKARHREIICLHYGLKDGKKYTSVEISNMLGISSEHVQKTLAELAIKHKALMTKIREFANVSEETAPAVTRVKEETERKQTGLNTYNGCAAYIEQTGRLIDIPSELQSDEGLIKLARIYALRNNDYSGIRKEHMNYLMCINYINKFHSLDMVPEKHRILQLMLYYVYCSGNIDCDPEWHEKGEIRAIYDIVRYRTDFMCKLGNPNIRVGLSDFPTTSREKAAAYFAKDEAHNALPTSSARAQINKLEDAKAKLGIIAEKTNAGVNNSQGDTTSVETISAGEENKQAPKNPMKTIERPN